MEKFGRYELIRRIATGGMAEIYLARQQPAEGGPEHVVLKRILPHLAENAEFVSMFLQEARVAVRLNHPNIVQIFDLGEESGSFFLAMEYIHGEDVRRVWRRAEEVGTSIPVPLACRIVLEAAAGLDYAHKKTDANGQPLNIIHRDVSPQNILVSFDGVVKVVDFGIAKAADQATHTRSGVLKGKYSYLSPEQASGKEIDQRTDQFALGVVLHELLTLRRLFKRGSDIQTLAAVTECRVLAPSEVNPRVPPDLDRIVLKALSRDPEERFRTMGEMQLALEEWIAASGMPGSSAHLAEFMKELYAERLAREEELGTPYFPEHSDASGNARKTAGSRNNSLVRGRAPKLTDPGGTRSERLVASSAASSAASTRSSADAEEPSPSPPEADEPDSPVDDRDLEVETTAPPAEDLRPLSVRMVRLAQRWGVFLLWTRFLKSPLGQQLVARPRQVVVAAVVAALAIFIGLLLLLMPEAEDPRTAGSSAADASSGPQRMAGAKILTVPPGARISVDGRPLKDRTPAIVPLPLGEHEIAVTLAGYRDEVRKVTLSKEWIIEPVSIDLQKEQRPVKLTIETVPAGALVSLEDKAIGKSPLTTELRGERTIELLLSHESCPVQAKPVVLGPGGAEQRVEIALDRCSGASGSGAGAGAGSGGTKQMGDARPASMGQISIVSDPQAALWWGKTLLGETPYRGKLPGGRHSMTIVNRKLGLEHDFVLPVVPGETTSRSFRFEKGAVQFVVPVSQWADVYLRNTKIGTLPMGPISLYEGDYVFTLVNPEKGWKKTITARIKPGSVEKRPINMASNND